MKELFFEEKAAGDFGAVYMILVFAIVALALVLVVKPMYQNAAKTIPKEISKP
ncbi:MAG: hypothetical protein HOE11_03280 [Candidatus Diapherotrites archaeon]|jgi:hypothetical protein|nr:hypothetical protein [Candidatus Diapherotrites archaeon]MBT4596920.1 hypothetical protein [Candidatus Diapherotrites archaeon]